MRDDKRGLTLVEIILALFIAAVLVGALVPTIYQTWQATIEGNARLLMADDLRTLNNWLTRDTQMAYPGCSSGGVGTLNLCLSDGYTSTYTVHGSELQRILSQQGASPMTLTVARQVASPADVHFGLGDGLLTATITFTVGSAREVAVLHAWFRPNVPTPTPTRTPTPTSACRNFIALW